MKHEDLQTVFCCHSLKNGIVLHFCSKGWSILLEKVFQIMMNIELSIYFPNVFILVFILKMFILSPFLVSSTFHQLSFVHFNKSNNTHTNQLYYFEVDAVF